MHTYDTMELDYLFQPDFRQQLRNGDVDALSKVGALALSEGKEIKVVTCRSPDTLYIVMDEVFAMDKAFSGIIEPWNLQDIQAAGSASTASSASSVSSVFTFVSTLGCLGSVGSAGTAGSLE